MWADSRGDKYYDVIPSGDQHFAVRTTDGAGRVLRYTKNLIRRDTVTGAFLWQGAHRTFELDTSGMPTRLVWRCRARGPEFHLDADGSAEGTRLAHSSTRVH